jgi:hypothetical protein
VSLSSLLQQIAMRYEAVVKECLKQCPHECGSPLEIRCEHPCEDCVRRAIEKSLCVAQGQHLHQVHYDRSTPRNSSFRGIN